MRFATRSLSLAVAVVLALTGCAASEAGTDGPSIPPRTPAPDATPIARVDLGEAPDPLGLVNLWRVSGAEGEGVDTWLRIDAGDFQLWRECGITSGAWQSNGNLFEASTWAADTACVPSMTVPWLESVASFRTSDPGWELTDMAGDVVATLKIDGAPESIPTAADFLTQPPVITDATREALRQAVPLADGFVPATPDDLFGRWVPAGYEGPQEPNEPYVRLSQNGTWDGSDGCNGSGGSWAAGEDGAFLATSGPTTLIGCDGYSVGYSMSRTTQVAIDGGGLILFDVDGIELMRLERT